MLSSSAKDFYSVLSSYNMAIWPLQGIVYLLIILALHYLFKRTNYSSKIILIVLSFFWLFTGIVFGLLYWGPSHIFGYMYGIGFTIQGILFLYDIIKSEIIIGTPEKSRTFIGMLFILYAIFGYQIFGYYIGHIYPVYFPVGLVPCPTIIFTFGIFLIFNTKIPIKYYLIPSLFAISGVINVYYGIYEDILLVIAGLSGTILIARKKA